MRSITGIRQESKDSAISETKEFSVFEGELLCLLVHSDQKHVGYINDFLSIIEDSVRMYGFKPERLSGEIVSDEDYLAKIVSLVDSCAVVLVILDGLRPNVTFEFGLAKAMEKPIIILRSKNSVVSIKSLYKALRDSGLTEKQFNKLQEPLLDPTSHLSDFAGKHVALIDREATEGNELHPASVLKKELTDRMAKILEEIQKLKSKDIDPKILSKVLPYLVKIINIYTAEKDFEIEELKDAFKRIYTLSENAVQNISVEIGNMVGSAIVRKAERQRDKNDIDSAISSFQAALEIYEKVLTHSSLEDTSEIYGMINNKVGYSLLQLYSIEGGKSNLTGAIDRFLFSLNVYTIQKNPTEYAIIQSNLALAYHKLSLIENFTLNMFRAIRAFEEAKRIYTIGSYPLQYAGICNNLANVYKDFGTFHYQTRPEKAVEYFELAIDFYSESLSIFIRKDPVMSAGIMNTRGSMYQNLAMMHNRVKENSDLALKDLKNSLVTYTLSDYPRNYGLAKYNIGVTYMGLYIFEHNESHRRTSIRSFLQAARAFDKDSKEYSDTQHNLGNMYLPLERTEYTAADCKNAINSYIKSLGWYSNKSLSFDYGIIWYSIGLAYHKLLKISNRDLNYKKMIGAFSESMTVITREENRRIYNSMLDIIRDSRI